MASSSGDSVRDRIALHLEFLGYEITHEERFVRARHPLKPNLTVRTYGGGILHTAMWGCNDYAKEHSTEYLGWINGLNRDAAVVRYYADEDLDLFIEAWYPNIYERPHYGSFLEAWDRDMAKFMSAPGDVYLS